jgi:two-component system chemotaxis response regulator CheB
MRNLISKIIEATPGLAVADKAMNGVFALQKIPRCDPDVIVLDIEMPEMNGIEFLKERKRLGLDIPVIILSSLAKEGAAITMEALALGASDFITKPSGSVSSDIHTVAGELSRLLLIYGSQHQRRKGKTPPRYDFEAPERMFEPAPRLDERAAERAKREPPSPFASRGPWRL